MNLNKIAYLSSKIGVIDCVFVKFRRRKFGITLNMALSESLLF